MARWNRPRAEGAPSSVLTLPPPPDWPKIVTLLGSPPKRAYFFHPLQRRDHVEGAGIAGLHEPHRRAPARCIWPRMLSR
jgi:hypothetical protein